MGPSSTTAGAIENRGDLTITNTTVTGNRAWQQGGGIYNTGAGNLTLTDSHVDGNTVLTEDSEMGTTYAIHGTSYTTTPSDGGYGGALLNNGGTVTVSNTTFDGNVSKYAGGGIYNPSGSMTLDSSPVTNNVSDYTSYTHDSTAWAFGGGIFNSGTLSFSNADISGNTTADLGGGFAISSTGNATLTNVFFDGNTATWGGAIEHYYCTDPTNLTLNNVTYGTNIGTDGHPNLDEINTCSPVSPAHVAPQMMMCTCCPP